MNTRKNTQSENDNFEVEVFFFSKISFVFQLFLVNVYFALYLRDNSK